MWPAAANRRHTDQAGSAGGTAESLALAAPCLRRLCARGDTLNGEQGIQMPVQSRVADLVSYLEDTQGSYGLWEYQPKPEASRWITYDILYSLSQLDEERDWISTEPRTKYKSYPRKPKRY